MVETRTGYRWAPILFRVAVLAVAAALAYIAWLTRPPAPAAQWHAGPTRPACSDVFTPGQRINFPAGQSALGCLDPGGNLQLPAAQECADGRLLYTVDTFVGPPAGWGFDGDVYHTVKAGSMVPTDPAFADASADCQG